MVIVRQGVRRRGFDGTSDIFKVAGVQALRWRHYIRLGRSGGVGISDCESIRRGFEREPHHLPFVALRAPRLKLRLRRRVRSLLVARED